jgi:hypothetical protein
LAINTNEKKVLVPDHRIAVDVERNERCCQPIINYHAIMSQKQTKTYVSRVTMGWNIGL